MVAKPPHHETYEVWKTNPTPDNLHKVVKSLSPTIQYALGQINAASDPVVRAKAELFTAKAVEKYNPELMTGASLPTFVSSQLRQLSRESRKSRSAVNIPERAQLDSLKLEQARKAFEDENGREPDVIELSDYIKMPVKRIEKMRTYQMRIPSEAALGEQEAAAPDWDREAVEYVHHDADHTDRRILELKTGFGGEKVLTPKEIAVKLRLTPTQLSRRSMRLSRKINELRETLEKV